MYTPFPRQVNKIIGLALMLFGFFLATPPGFLTPDDFLDIILATHLSRIFNISFGLAIVLSYTVIAWSLIYVGALIYPYNTRKLINGKFHKVKSLALKSFSNPYYFAAMVFSILVLIWFANWYQGYILAKLSSGGLI